MRIAHRFTPWCAAVLAALTVMSPWAWSQTTLNPDWLQPNAPSLPLQHLPLPASGGVEPNTQDWPAANAAVARFPRGHADVLQWEKSQTAAKPAAAGQGHAAQQPHAMPLPAQPAPHSAAEHGSRP